MIGDQEILKKEMDLLLEDLRDAYEASGKKVSGEWEEGLEVVYTDKGAKLYGYAYLAGRQSGKQPPMQKIRDWVEARGITGSRGNLTSTQLAYAIAKKIGNEGTNKESHKAIYEEVITPQRIQSIIDNVSAFNVQEFVNAVTVEMNLLTTNL